MTAPTPPSASDFLLGSGAKGKSASFLNVGTSITGTICKAPEVKQQIDPDTNKPAVWDDGGAKWQIVVALQTDDRNPEIDADDGVRYLYVKGSKDPVSQSLHAAVAGAVGAAGASELEVGGRLTVTYVADGVKSSPTRTAPKKYTASYIPAAAAALGVPQQAQPAATTPAPVTYAAPEQTVAAGPDPALLAAVANLPELQRNAILAAPGMTPEMATAMVAAMAPKAS